MQSSIVRHLLRRLKELRKRAGLTQEEFAERANMSYKFYQRIESDKKRDLRLSTVERLALAHGISVSQLLAEKRQRRNRK